MIVCIAGAPGTGKSWLGEMMALTSGTALIRTDDYIPRGWSAASLDIAAQILVARGDLLVEGVAVPRALRKALELCAGPPCDRLVLLRTRRGEAGAELAGQAAMRKGMMTVLRGIWAKLVARGVEIVDRNGVAIERL